ncbi:Major facilitator superfamily domain general substrate transporter [Penicillium expansum]|nr:Major facilitator superfamily domain general substrate transporter [Penicillium expansum]
MSHSNLEQVASTAMQSARSRLLELPTEILQDIACYLPSDRDILNLSLSCKETWSKVFESESAIWRYRFGKHYDIVPGRPSRELKIEYQIRAIVLSSPIQFKEEEDDRQYLWMEVMQTMLEESLKLSIAPGATSKTLERIHETLKGGLSSFALDPTITEPCRRTDYDIKQVYSYAEKVGKAFIDHENLDLAKLLSLRNFWQRHFLNASEFTYQESFSGLPAELRPRARKDIPNEVSKLSPSWLGYYSCMHPLSDLLKINERQTCADLETHGDGLDVMVVSRPSISNPPPKSSGPSNAARLSPLAGSPNTKRTYFDGKQRAYGGAYEVGNPVFGFTEEIAIPHGGVGGWTRICFTIVEGDEEEEEKSPSLIMDGEGWIHGYEAIIIPGGCMMLGRWMDMKEPEARGPFIFWDV